MPLISKMRVYVVDDDAAVRDSLRALLESYDMVVDDFETALQFLASGPTPINACLIADVHMPGMDGIELLYQLKSSDRQPPTILITGQIDPVLVERATAAGALVILEKPVSEAELMQALEKAAGS